MQNSVDDLRRWLGTFCLAVAAGLLIWGQTILKPYLDGALFLIYWFACFLFTIAAIAIAMLDARAVRRRLRQEQLDLIERTLKEVKVEEKAPVEAGSPVNDFRHPSLPKKD